jgi:hypothetical protein
MATVLAVLASSLLAAPMTASAGCPEEIYVSITSVKGIHMWDRRTYFKDGPGGTMTGKVTESSTISATLSAGAEISISTLVTTVKAQVTASATRARTTSIGHDYSHNVKAGKYGNLKYGSWAKKVGWKKTRVNRSCTATVLDRGTGRVPTQAVGWHFWHTSS